MEEQNGQGLRINQETMDVLVANIIPTTKYFESRFDHLQYQIDEVKEGQKNLKRDMDSRFDAMQKEMDSRFEKVDQRFDAMQPTFPPTPNEQHTP